jgi:hypothetical protein
VVEHKSNDTFHRRIERLTALVIYDSIKPNYTPEEVGPGDLSDHRPVDRAANIDGLVGVAENHRTGWGGFAGIRTKGRNKPTGVLSRFAERRSFRSCAVSPNTRQTSNYAVTAPSTETRVLLVFVSKVPLSSGSKTRHVLWSCASHNPRP